MELNDMKNKLLLIQEIITIFKTNLKKELQNMILFFVFHLNISFLIFSLFVYSSFFFLEFILFIEIIYIFIIF